MWQVIRAVNKNYGFNLQNHLGQYLIAGKQICWFRWKKKAQEQMKKLNNQLKNRSDFSFEALHPCKNRFGGWGTTDEEENSLCVEIDKLRFEIRNLKQKYDKAMKNNQVKTAHILLSLLEDKKQFLRDIIRINKEDFKIIISE